MYTHVRACMHTRARMSRARGRYDGAADKQTLEILFALKPDGPAVPCVCMAARTRHARSTHAVLVEVLTRYSRGTHAVLTRYSRGTHAVLTRYAWRYSRCSTHKPGCGHYSQGTGGCSRHWSTVHRSQVLRGERRAEQPADVRPMAFIGVHFILGSLALPFR